MNIFIREWTSLKDAIGHQPKINAENTMDSAQSIAYALAYLLVTSEFLGFVKPMDLRMISYLCENPKRYVKHAGEKEVHKIPFHGN